MERGRPTKLTSANILALSEHVENGMDADTACSLVGISPSTLKKWRQEGRRYLETEPDVSLEEWMDKGILSPHLEQSLQRASSRAEGILPLCTI